MAKTKKELDLDAITVPTHVAIIMDGNGRWARQRNLKIYAALLMPAWNLASRC